jgi:hypothetical protein
MENAADEGDNINVDVIDNNNMYDDGEGLAERMLLTVARLGPHLPSPSYQSVIYIYDE